MFHGCGSAVPRAERRRPTSPACRGRKCAAPSHPAPAPQQLHRLGFSPRSPPAHPRRPPCPLNCRRPPPADVSGDAFELCESRKCTARMMTARSAQVIDQLRHDRAAPPAAALAAMTRLSEGQLSFGHSLLRMLIGGWRQAGSARRSASCGRARRRRSRFSGRRHRQRS